MLPTLKWSLLGVTGVVGFAFAALPFGGSSTPKADDALVTAEAAPVGPDKLTVAGGCFWCLEPLYEELKGVTKVESAYVGGAKKNPTYEQVCGGATGHAEAVTIFFDPAVISKADLLRLFFVTHDPTTLNRQGVDSGTQYRSAIFFHDAEEKELAEKIKAEIEAKKVWKDRIVTTIEPFLNYTRAEEYHQDYYAKFEKATPMQQMRMNAGYCINIVQPKVQKFRKEYQARLKKG